MRLSGIAEYADGEFPQPPSTPLEGWQLFWIDDADPAAKGAAGLTTLAELRSWIDKTRGPILAPISGQNSRTWCQDRCVWTPGWTEIHSGSYGLKEAQVQACMDKPGSGYWPDIGARIGRPGFS